MTARVIHESYGGGSLTVDIASGRLAYPEAAGTIRLDAFQRGGDPVVLHLTPAEVVEAIAALNAKLVELATTDTRSSAPPVADDRGAGHGGPSAAVPGRIPSDRPTLASMLGNARGELLAASTPVGGAR